MPSLGDLLVTVGAKIDGFEKAMGTVSQRLNAIDRDASKATRGFEKLSDKLIGVGTTLTAGLTVPLAAIGVATTKMAADFELGMRKVTSLVGGASDKEFADLSRQVLELSKVMGVDAVKATAALYETISAGIPKGNAIEFLKVATTAAIAGVTDTAVAVDALTTIIEAFGLKTTDAKAVADAMFQAVNIGKFQFADLAKAIGPAAQQASNLGISYQELLAATATLSLTSGGVSQAVTQIESAMRALLDPTTEMSAALGEFQTGSAAIKALGFEGTLEMLRQKTHGSAEAFNALFGRIEGATGALGLTGDKAQKAAKDLDVMKHSMDGLGASQIAANEINKSTSREFERLIASLKVTSIEMGQSLLPTVNDLLKSLQPLSLMLGDLAEQFAALPESTRLTAIGLLAVFAALGPLLIVTSGIINALVSLKAGLAVLGALGSGATATGIALTAVAMLALGAAFAAWKYQDQLLGIQLMIAAFNVVTRVTQFWIDTLKELTIIAVTAGSFIQDKLAIPLTVLRVLIPQVSGLYESLTASLRGFNAGFDQKNISFLDDFKAKMSEAGQAVKKAMEDAVKGFSDFGDATTKITVKVDTFRQAVDAEKQSIIESEKKKRIHTQAIGELGMAIVAATTIMGRFRQAVDLEKQALLESEKAKIVHRTALRELGMGFGETLGKTRSLIEGFEDLGDVTRELGGTVKDLKAIQLPDWLAPSKAAEESIERLSEAARRLGIEWGKTSESLIADFEMIRDAGIFSAEQIERAWKKAQDAIDAEWKEHPPMVGAVSDEAWKKAQDSAKKGVSQISTIINDMGRAFANAFQGFIKSLFTTGSFNADLDKQEAALRASLVERTAEWIAYQAKTWATFEATTRKHKEQLDEQLADIQRSLEERQADYLAFEQETQDKISDLRMKAADDLARVQEGLFANLRDKEGAYQEFIEETIEKEDDLRRTIAERLEGQLDDLRVSLRDRVEAYDDFVADANLRLSRIGEDTTENIDDEQRSTNRKLEDENRDFTRDIEKLNEDLREADKKGDKTRSAEIRRTLRQREEDHERTLRRIKEDFDEHVSDVTQRAKQQTSDIKTDLARRLRDHQQFLAQNATDQEAAQAKAAADLDRGLGDIEKARAAHTAALLAFRETTAAALAQASLDSAKQLADDEFKLNVSLGERRQALDNYITEVNRRIIAAVAAFDQGQADELQALQDGFADKLKEYEKFKTDLQPKLDALEKQHRTFADNIIEMFRGIGESALNSLLRLASEEIWKTITDGIIDKIKNSGIGKAFESLFDLLIDGLQRGLGAVFDALGRAIGAGSGPNAPSPAPPIPVPPGGSPPGTSGPTPVPGTPGWTAQQGVQTFLSAWTAISSTISNLQLSSLLDIMRSIAGTMAVLVQVTILDVIGWLKILTSDYMFTIQADILAQINDNLTAINEKMVEVRALLRSLDTNIASFAPAFAATTLNATPSPWLMEGGTITIHTHVNLNGREIARALAEVNELDGGGIG